MAGRLPDQRSEFISQIISAYAIQKRLEGFQEVSNKAAEAFSVQTAFHNAHEAGSNHVQFIKFVSDFCISE